MGTTKEQDSLLRQLFPVGEERWVKMKYTDFEKACSTFGLYGRKELKERQMEHIGAEVLAIGCRPENVPQIAAIMDLKEDILGSLINHIPEEKIKEINSIFKLKCDELKRRAIHAEEIDN